jgi:hypothetical protein
MKRVWREAVVVCLGYYPGICLMGQTKTINVKALADIRTEYFPNTRLECYCYINTLGEEQFQ